MSFKNNHLFCLLYSWLIKLITAFLPDQKHIMRFRGWLYSFAMKKCGKNFQVSAGAKISCLQNLDVGDNVFIATNVVINAGTSVTLEDEVMLGIASILVSGNHTLNNGSYRFGAMQRSPIVVGKGSWIGANVTLIAGCQIPPSSLIAANSVVNKSFTVSGTYGGVPAKLIKMHG
jgi:acetyltransferase-like isoleucine patch superfamily enzyme